MTDLEKLEIACTANDGRFREMTINRAYLIAGLVDYTIFFWNSKDLNRSGLINVKTYQYAKKTASKLSHKGYFGNIDAFDKVNNQILASNLWSFGR